VAVLALPLFVAAPARGQGIVALDFESYPGPDGRLGTADDIPTPSCPGFCGLLSDEFEPVGLTFTSGTLFQGGLFPSTPSTNHFLSSTPPDVVVSQPARWASVDSYSAWSAVLWLLDDEDQDLARTTLVNPSPGAPYSGSVSLASGAAWTRVTVRPEGCSPADECSDILNVDHLVVAFLDVFADGFEDGGFDDWSFQQP